MSNEDHRGLSEFKKGQDHSQTLQNFRDSNKALEKALEKVRDAEQKSARQKHYK